MERKLLSVFGLALVLLWSTLMPSPQAQDTSCLAQLAPCFNYLNGEKDPPSSCCDPLKSVIKSNPKCLCSLASTKGSSAAGRAGIDVAKAQELPGRCGQTVNPIGCLVTNSPGGKNMVKSGGTRISLDEVIPIVALAAVIHIFRC